MIVAELKKSKKKNLYIVKLDSYEYELSEDIVVRYRLVKGKEIESSLLKNIIKDNDLDKLYNKALNYSIRYGKGSSEVELYLKDKGATKSDSKIIVERLKENKIINDSDLIDSLIFSYTKSANGILMIKDKLYQKGYDKDLVEEKLDNIDYDLYYKKMNEHYLKSYKSYKHDDEYNRVIKAKNSLLRRGYTYSDLEKITK